MTAPFFAALADGPPDGRAAWLTTSDNRRIRAAIWGADAPQGTVFLFPGRTEYVEKYGRAAGDLYTRGFATLSVDFRGQGLSDRALTDKMAGHVGDFAEYQHDVAALADFARASNLPRPWFLLSHSMGGCIALRTLMGRHEFQAAAFSAPMWGILISAWQRPMAEVLSGMSRWLHFDHLYAPGTGSATYVTNVPFAGNTLTTDPAMWDYMRCHLVAEPQLALGGPTLGWLRAALTECAALQALPCPALPAHVGLGTHERIVDPNPVHARMAGWTDGKLDLFGGAEHEIMMEGPAMRARFFDAVAGLFTANR